MKDKLRIYFIAGPQNFPGKSISDAEKSMISIINSGVTMFQFRDKNFEYKNHEDRFKLAQSLKLACFENKIPFIINDDLDFAVSIKSDGVHLGQNDIDISFAKELIGNGIIGLSVTNKKELEAAQISCADYLGIGPIFNSKSKLTQSVLGIDKLNEALKINKKPIVGIGGISFSNLDEIASAEIDGIAVISLLIEGDIPSIKIKTINEILNNNNALIKK